MTKITPELLETLGITKEDILNKIADNAKEASTGYEFEEHYVKVYTAESKRVNKEIREKLSEEADAIIETEIKKVIGEIFNKRDIWGEYTDKDAIPTVLEQIIARTKNYLAAKVDNQGNPTTDRWHQKQTKAEYLLKFCLDEQFNYTINRNIEVFQKEVTEQLKVTYKEQFDALLTAKLKDK